jgi:hypothetical protein
LSATVKAAGAAAEFNSPKVRLPSAGLSEEVISICWLSALILPANRRWKPLGP